MKVKNKNYYIRCQGWSYSERIPSRYVNVCITLRKWLKMANTALGGDTVNEE